MLDLYTNVKDFLIAHYKVTSRDDTPFWQRCRRMDIPDSLRGRLEIFARTGNVQVQAHELFKETSWFSVLFGQGMIPEEHHPMADVVSETELKLRMARIRTTIRDKVSALPTHDVFLKGLRRQGRDLHAETSLSLT